MKAYNIYGICIIQISVTYAAPAFRATKNCIAPNEFKKQLFTVLFEDLGQKFTEDFDDAYNLTLKIAQFDDANCFDYTSGQFLCTTLQTVYNTRVPEAAKTVLDDCNEIIDKFYPITK
ncbi:unnamed protein product [Mucor hiemalis]